MNQRFKIFTYNRVKMYQKRKKPLVQYRIEQWNELWKFNSELTKQLADIEFDQI
jgi:hypothetical protein